MGAALIGPGPKLSEVKAAARLDVSPFTLKRWRVEGIGPPYLKIGARAVRYDQNELDAWAAQNRRGPSSRTGRDGRALLA